MRRLTGITDCPNKDELTADAPLVLHMAEDAEEGGQRERHARTSGDKYHRVVVVQVGRETVWAVDEHLNLLPLLRDARQALRETLADVDQEHKLFPVGRDVNGVRESLLNVSGRRGLDTGELIMRVDGCNGERVHLERDAGDGWHGKESGLTRGPVEVGWAVDVQANEVRRQQFNGRVKPVGLGVETKVQVVVVDNAREADEAVEAPNEERRPDVCALLEQVGVEVATKEQDPSPKNWQTAQREEIVTILTEP